MEMAALKETHRKEMAAMELEHLRQSGAVVPWAELPDELVEKVLEVSQPRHDSSSQRSCSTDKRTLSWGLLVAVSHCPRVHAASLSS